MQINLYKVTTPLGVYHVCATSWDEASGKLHDHWKEYGVGTEAARSVSQIEIIAYGVIENGQNGDKSFLQ